MQSANNPPTDFSTIKNLFNEALFITGPHTGWRMRAKLAVRGTVQKPLIGLFKEGTHTVIDMQVCPDHHPAIDAALEIVRKALPEHGIIPYDEKTLYGHLRYLQCVVERQTGRVQLTLVANNTDEPLLPLVEYLVNKNDWHSIWINVQEGSTNTIFGKKWIHVFGEKDLWQTLCDTPLCFHPGCFAQANLNLFERILSDLLERILPGKNVIELYGGVGTIGLVALKKSRSLLCVESNPLCEECFLKSAKNHSAEYIRGDAKALTEHLDGQEVLIVDPPRKGIDATLMKKILSTTTLEQIIYVSCDAQTFARDAKKLLAVGWKIDFARSYELFPGTSHIETLAMFTH